MKIRFMLSLSLLMACLTGCVPSLRGIGSEETLTYDNSLLGVWHNPDNSDRWQFVAHPKLENQYRVIYIDSDQKLPGQFAGQLNRIGGALILDLSAEVDETSANAFYRMHLWPMHTFVRVTQEQSKLTLSVMNPQAVKALVQAQPEAIRHELIEDGVVLTDSTAKLQNFVAANLKTEDFFGDPMTLTRKDSDKMLTVGEMAPDFNVTDQSGKPATLSEFKGKKNVVLIFYPGDDTPGCTKQLCAVRDDFSQFDGREVAFFGVNPQSAQSHQKFIDKYNFPFPILVDKDKEIIKAYGCAGLVSTTRTVYGIDKSGKVVFAQRGMPANSEILAAFEPQK